MRFSYYLLSKYSHDISHHVAHVHVDVQLLEIDGEQHQGLPGGPTFHIGTGTVGVVGFDAERLPPSRPSAFLFETEPELVLVVQKRRTFGFSFGNGRSSTCRVVFLGVARRHAEVTEEHPTHYGATVPRFRKGEDFRETAHVVFERSRTDIRYGWNYRKEEVHRHECDGKSDLLENLMTALL